MKRLLALKGIKSVSYVNYDKEEHLFPYTENMLGKGIFIEVYEEVDNPESDKGYKTCIYVYLIQESNCYEFTILFDPRPYVPPIYLYRIILDTIEIIENSEPQSLTDHLKEAAMTSLKTDDYPNKKKQDFNQRVKLKVQAILTLIGQKDGIHKPGIPKRHID